MDPQITFSANNQSKPDQHAQSEDEKEFSVSVNHGGGAAAPETSLTSDIQYVDESSGFTTTSNTSLEEYDADDASLAGDISQYPTPIRTPTPIAEVVVSAEPASEPQANVPKLQLQWSGNAASDNKVPVPEPQSQELQSPLRLRWAQPVEDTNTVELPPPSPEPLSQSLLNAGPAEVQGSLPSQQQPDKEVIAASAPITPLARPKPVVVSPAASVGHEPRRVVRELQDALNRIMLPPHLARKAAAATKTERPASRAPIQASPTKSKREAVEIDPDEWISRMAIEGCARLSQLSEEQLARDHPELWAARKSGEFRARYSRDSEASSTADASTSGQSGDTTHAGSRSAVDVGSYTKQIDRRRASSSADASNKRC